MYCQEPKALNGFTGIQALHTGPLARWERVDADGALQPNNKASVQGPSDKGEESKSRRILQFWVSKRLQT